MNENTPEFPAETATEIMPDHEGQIITPLTTQPIIGDEAYEKASLTLGLVKCRSADLKALRDLGLYNRANDAVAIACGSTYVDESRIEKWLEDLNQIVDGASDDPVKIQAAMAAAALISRSIENNRSRIRLIELAMMANKGTTGGGRPRNRSFVPGVPIVAQKAAVG